MDATTLDATTASVKSKEAQLLSLVRELCGPDQHSIHLSDNLGSIHVYVPPVNAREEARKYAAQITDEERNRWYQISLKDTLTTEEMIDLVNEPDEDDVPIPQSVRSASV